MAAHALISTLSVFTIVCSCAKCTKLKLLEQVYLPSVQETTYRYRRAMLTRDTTAAYSVLTGSLLVESSCSIACEYHSQLYNG